jgi:hypothetical protein
MGFKEDTHPDLRANNALGMHRDLGGCDECRTEPDHLICPIKGTPIYEGEGTAVMDSKGNLWIVSAEAAAEGVRKDAFADSVHGVKPIAGPDA